MLAISFTIACSRYIYYGVILHAHPVRGESHNQRNTTGEVVTELNVVCEQRWIQFELQNSPTPSRFLHLMAKYTLPFSKP